MLKAADLPDDLEALKRLVIDTAAAYDAARAELIAEQLEVERLRFQIAVLKRQQYGRSSEQLDTRIAQLSFVVTVPSNAYIVTFEDEHAHFAENPHLVLRDTRSNGVKYLSCLITLL